MNLWVVCKTLLFVGGSGNSKLGSVIELLYLYRSYQFINSSYGLSFEPLFEFHNKETAKRKT